MENFIKHNFHVPFFLRIVFGKLFVLKNGRDIHRNAYKWSGELLGLVFPEFNQIEISPHIFV
jgi:hypothetical protein